MKRIAGKFTLLSALALLLTSCLKEDMSDCDPAIALRFVFTHHDHTETVTDLFAEHVDDIHVYIFDQNETFVRYIQATQNTLTDGNTLYLDLEAGEYKITAWGNLLGSSYEVSQASALRPDYTIQAKESHSAANDLFHGTASLTVEKDDLTQEVSLIRNTHMVRVRLLGLPEPARNTIDDTDYSVRILGSNALYNFDNTPVAETAAIYTPSYSGLTIDDNYVVQAEFKVQRLLTGDDTRLQILDAEEIETEDSLTERILSTYEEITADHHLDKRYIYELYYEVDYRGGWVFIGNNIKDWQGNPMPGEL